MTNYKFRDTVPTSEPIQETQDWVKKKKEARKQLLQAVWRRRSEHWKLRLRKILHSDT